MISLMTGSREVPSGAVHARSLRAAAGIVACVLAACGGDAAPVARSASLRVAENSVLSAAFPVEASPLTSLTFAIVEPPSHGAIDVDPAARTFRYRPEPYFNGEDAFVYTASDASRTSAPATVSVTVTPVNDRPLAKGVGSTDVGTVTGGNVIEVPEDAIVTGRLAAADPDQDALVFDVVSPPANGLLIVDSATGSFTYQPLPDWGGTDAFTFTVSDGSLYSEPVTVSILVIPVNDPPVAASQAVLLDEDTSITGQLAATDVEGSALTFVVTAPPAHGAVDVNAATGAFTYVPGADYYGSDSFRFAASDGELSSQAASVSIVIRPVPTVPVVSAPPFVISGRGGYTASAVPVPGDTVTWSIDGGDLVGGDSAAADSSVVFTAGPLPAVTLTAIATRGGVISQPTVVVVPAAPPPVVPLEKSVALSAIPDASLDLGLPDLRSSTTMSVSVTNLSGTPLTNPQVFAENRPAPYAIDDILNALPMAGSDREKAEAAWRYVRDRFFHYCSGGSQDRDPPDIDRNIFASVNGFGFGCCNQTASYLAGLWKHLGFQVRMPYMAFHTVPEVFYEGAWHMYDPDHRTFYLKRDGQTVASVEDILADPGLVLLAADEQGFEPSGWMAAVVADYYAEATLLGYAPAPDIGEQPQLTLMPKETFTLFHANQTGSASHYPAFGDPFDPSNVTSGVFRWHLSADQESLSRPGVTSQNLQLTRSADGHQVLQQASASSGSIVVRRTSPFPLLGARVWVRLDGATDSVSASFSNDGLTWTRGLPVTRSRERAGYTHVADLTSQASSHRQYYLRVDVDGGASIESIGLEARVQVNKFNFPMFAQGPVPYDYRPVVQTPAALFYRDDSPAGQARAIVAAAEAVSTDTQIQTLELLRDATPGAASPTYVSTAELVITPPVGAGPEEDRFDYIFTFDEAQIVRQIRATLFQTASPVTVSWRVEARLSADDSWQNHISGSADIGGRLEIDTFVLAKQIRLSGTASTPVRFVKLAAFGEPTGNP